MSNAEFESGDDGHGHGEGTFWSNKPNPKPLAVGYCTLTVIAEQKTLDIGGMAVT